MLRDPGDGSIGSLQSSDRWSAWELAWARPSRVTTEPETQSRSTRSQKELRPPPHSKGEECRCEVETIGWSGYLLSGTLKDPVEVRRIAGTPSPGVQALSRRATSAQQFSGSAKNSHVSSALPPQLATMHTVIISTVKRISALYHGLTILILATWTSPDNTAIAGLRGDTEKLLGHWR